MGKESSSSLHILKPAVGASAFAQGFVDGITPEKPMSMVEWADTKRKLSSKSSPEPGQWKTSRVPFMIEIMESLSSNSPVQDVSLMKGTQIAGTEVGNNFVGYVIDHAPAPMMCVQPTLDMAKRYSRQRVGVMINDMPSLADKVADGRSRDGGNTLLEKDFVGGYLVITGANSATGLRSMPVQFLFLDETDAYPFDLDNEGDPEKLAEKRTQNFSRKKIFRVSTPTVDGMSRIKKAFDRGDQRYYHIPCPHCGGEQKLIWKQLKWDKTLSALKQPSSAYYECIHCEQPITEKHKTEMLDAGRWIPDNLEASPKRRSYHLNSLYSPVGWYSWAEAVEDWLDAQGDVELLKTFTNTVLAEVWKEAVNDVNAEILSSKADGYELGIVPKGGLVLTSGSDTQDGWLVAYVYATGRNEERWLVDYEVFHGDPGIPDGEPESPWTEMKDWLDKPWQHESGQMLKVERKAVDTGGHHTHDVYNFCRRNSHLGYVAIKGSSQRNSPILSTASRVDVDWRGKTMQRGLQLYKVGTDTAKSLIYSRFLQEKESSSGFIHFPDSLPHEIFEELTAEKLIRKYRKGYAFYEWVKESAARNEALDCLVYAIAASYRMGLHRYSQKRWDEIEAEVQPLNGDLFSPAVVQETAEAKKSKRFKTVKAGGA